MKISNEKLMVVAVWYGKSILQKRIKKIKPFLERFSLFLQITDIKKKENSACANIYIYIDIYFIYSNGLDKKRSKSFDVNG